MWFQYIFAKKKMLIIARFFLFSAFLSLVRSLISSHRFVCVCERVCDSSSAPPKAFYKMRKEKNEKNRNNNNNNSSRSDSNGTIKHLTLHIHIRMYKIDTHKIFILYLFVCVRPLLLLFISILQHSCMFMVAVISYVALRHEILLGPKTKQMKKKKQRE